MATKRLKHGYKRAPKIPLSHNETNAIDQARKNIIQEKSRGQDCNGSGIVTLAYLKGNEKRKKNTYIAWENTERKK